MKESDFWVVVMLRQSCFWAPRASPAQKSRGLRVVLFHKLFKGYIYCLLGHSVDQYAFELFDCETNLKKKCSVRVWRPYFAGVVSNRDHETFPVTCGLRSPLIAFRLAKPVDTQLSWCLDTLIRGSLPQAFSCT
jgi:hypothetical protein